MELIETRTGLTVILFARGDVRKFLHGHCSVLSQSFQGDISRGASSPGSRDRSRARSRVTRPPPRPGCFAQPEGR